MKILKTWKTDQSVIHSGLLWFLQRKMLLTTPCAIPLRAEIANLTWSFSFLGPRALGVWLGLGDASCLVQKLPEEVTQLLEVELGFSSFSIS